MQLLVRERLRLPMALLLAVALFALYAATPGGRPPFSSPDEAANFAFTERVAAGERPQLGGGPDAAVTHPRSVRISGARLLPGTFLGLPLYFGWMGRILGYWVLPFLTPLLAVGGVFALFVVTRRVFGVRIAILSALLLAVQPVFWLYAARAYWHNAAFLALVLCAAAAVSGIASDRKFWRYAVAGGCLGLALAFRSAELPWILGATALYGWFARRVVNPFGVAVFVVALLAPLVPVLVVQNALYGNAVAGAYAGAFTDAFQAPTPIERVASALLPYGVHPKAAFHVLTVYFFGLMFPFTVPALLGAVAQLTPSVFRRHPERSAYAAGWLGLTVWLGLFYGSFTFVEFRPDPDAAQLGSSYLRYLLPALAFGLPLSVAGIKAVAVRFPKPRLVGAGLLSAVVLLGTVRAITDRYDGITTSAGVRREFIALRQMVLAGTPPDAVVVAGPNDKVLWPARQVVGYDPGPVPAYVIRALPALAREHAVYFLGAERESDRLGSLLSSDIELTEVSVGRGDGALYRLDPVRAP